MTLDNKWDQVSFFDGQASIRAERIFQIYFNLDLTNIVLAIIPIGYDNIVLTKLIAEIS